MTCGMKMLPVLSFLFGLALIAPCFADAKEEARVEIRALLKERSELKKMYNALVSGLRKEKNPELVAIEKKSRLSSGPITKAMEGHPDLAEVRKDRDEAIAAFAKASQAKDQEGMKAARKARSAAESKYYKVGYTLKEIIPLIKSREALGKEVAATKLKLVMAKDAELVSKMEAVEARYDELMKIIRG